MLFRSTASRRRRETHALHRLSATLRRKGRAVCGRLCGCGHCGPASAIRLHPCSPPWSHAGIPRSVGSPKSMAGAWGLSRAWWGGVPHSRWSLWLPRWYLRPAVSRAFLPSTALPDFCDPGNSAPAPGPQDRKQGVTSPSGPAGPAPHRAEPASPP